MNKSDGKTGILDLEKMGITSPKEVSPELRKVIKKVGLINHQIVNLVSLRANREARLKEIKEQKKILCAKLSAEERELKQADESEGEKVLLLLGEREAHRKTFKEFGAVLSPDDATKIISRQYNRLVEED